MQSRYLRNRKKKKKKGKETSGQALFLAGVLNLKRTKVSDAEMPKLAVIPAVCKLHFMDQCVRG
jgi:hypothetical protein